jgi:hypothetical protein
MKPARILLGLFICWQLFFLVSSNLLSLLPRVRDSWQDKPKAEAIAPDWLHEKGRVAEAERDLTRLTTRWAEISGQPQNWSLFAPNVTRIIPFVAVEFSWDEDPMSVRWISRQLAPLAAGRPFEEAIIGSSAWHDDRSGIEHRLANLLSTGEVQAPPPTDWRPHPRSSIVLLSANEPADVHRFVRFGKFRLRRYESNIDVSLASPDKEPESVVDSWRENIEDRVRGNWRLIEAYLQWQLRRWSQKHPDLPPPKQVILWIRLYRVPPPEDVSSPWNWQGPEWHPVARWQPGVAWETGLLPVEMFNPVVPRFESVREPHESEQQ